MYLKSFIEQDIATINAVETLVKSKDEKRAIEEIDKLKETPSIEMEKVKKVLLLQKQDYNLTNGLVATFIAIIAIFLSIVEIDIPWIDDIAIFAVIALIVIFFILKQFFPLVDKLNRTEQRNKKIDYLIWLIEKE
ncbi:hypothetical protein [Bacillus sp. REN16]|uniref:hypothetical protein n=1 Tax=Bacillus sp. REN16 TaxID=2887296 RepID=UPI001E344294|nr:hypothetical protein [Bacillus sp. REN16]MCC3358192.1 hypothetical protein [Bacillus sp. REN16]